MAYGFLCAHCGHQSSAHVAWDGRVNHANEHLRGFKFTLEKCPGFTYQKSDEASAVEMFREEPVPYFPDFLRERAERLDGNERERNGPINHSVIAIIGGHVVDIGS